jgi:hypothetical protein
MNCNGSSLRGENTYRLHVPANVLVSQFWSVTVYNSDTAALFLNLTLGMPRRCPAGGCPRASETKHARFPVVYSP